MNDLNHNPLENFKFLDLSLWSNDRNLKKALESIFSEISPSLGKSIKRHKETYLKNLSVLTLNLYSNFFSDPDLYTACPRDNNNPGYTKGFRYNKNGVTKVIIKVVDALIKYGFIDDYKKGFLNRDTGYGKKSRIRASEKLIKTLNQSGFNRNSISENRELIELRGKKRFRTINGERKKIKGPLIDYSDNDETIKMRKNLIKINRFLRDQKIHLPKLYEKKQELKKGYPINYSKTTLYRVFSNENKTFEEGGRFYGHWGQWILKKYREHLRINGENVCEWDYRRFHINMVYALAGIKPPKGADQYRVIATARYKRKLSKKVLNAMLNSYSEKQAIKGVYKDIQKDEKLSHITEKEIELLLDQLTIKHKEIEHFFHDEIGLYLHRLDSDLAEKIMLRLMNKDIPFIPIHDSFIVQTIHENELTSAMGEEYEKEFKVKPKFKKVY